LVEVEALVLAALTQCFLPSHLLAEVAVLLLATIQQLQVAQGVAVQVLVTKEQAHQGLQDKVMQAVMVQLVILKLMVVVEAVPLLLELQQLHQQQVQVEMELHLYTQVPQ
jgi:hypothetical protein